MKVAILYIGIGQYVDFWKGFYISCENHFLHDIEKQYFMFTDAESIYAEEKVHKIYQEDIGWPGNSLMRYSFFMNIINDLEEFDYIYFFNGNILFLQDISTEEFCPKDDSLLVVEHHYFVDKRNELFPYDRNEKSRAYIPYGEGEHYVCGGLNGAKSNVFINFIKYLYEEIEIDKNNNVVALWHDESHVNRYILDYKQIMLLPPSYCYPELVANPEISNERKIICRDKRNYFNLYRFKEPEKELNSLINDSKMLLTEGHYEKLEYRWLFLKETGVSLGEYFRNKDINFITVIKQGRLGDIFYREISRTNINIIKILNSDYVDLYYEGMNVEFSESGKKQFATVVTDTYNFSKLYEILYERGERNIISLEDIINTLYDKCVRPKLLEEVVGMENYTNVMDMSPLDKLPKNSRIVLYGGGRIGRMFYSRIQRFDYVNLMLWVDADYKRKQQEGLPIHSIEMIKDTSYDLLILGTSLEHIADSMKQTLKNKNISLEKAVWYNKETHTWE